MVLASTRNFHKGNIPPGEIRSMADTVMRAASVSVLSDMILCLPVDIYYIGKARSQICFLRLTE